MDVEAHGQNQSQSFIFDTGSPCVYSFETKWKLELKSKKLFSLAGSRAESSIDSLKIGGIQFKNVALLISNHEVFDNSSGLIGVNLMDKGIWQINFQDSTIKFSNNLQHFEHIEGSYSTRFRPLGVQQTPVLKLHIGNDSVEAFLDTGFPGFIQLNGDYNPGKDISSQMSYRNVNALGNKGKGDYFVYTNYLRSSLQISNLKIDTAVVTKVNQYKGRNLIGIDFLKNYIVTVNWITQTVFLKPTNENIYRRACTYGFNCYPVDGVLKVTEVYKNSIAEKHGIKSGDVILSVDGEPMTIGSKTFNDINNDLPNNREISVEIKGKPTIKLKKEDIFK